MRRSDPLHRVLLVTHAVLILATAAGIAVAGLGLGGRAALLVVVLAPLALGVPGLYAGRLYTYQWMALAMVLFAGGAVVEVVATLGRSVPAGLVLLAALLELAVLFVLSRRAR